VILVLVASAIAGVVPGALPLGLTLALCVCGLLALTALGLRWVLLAVSSHAMPKRLASPVQEPSGRDEVVERDGLDLRLSRMLFYLGTALVAEAKFRPALGLTVSEMLFMAAFAGCVFAALRGSTVTSLPRPVVAGVCIFAFGGVISSLGAHSPANSEVQVLHAAYVLLLWAWTGVMLLRTRPQILLAMTLWVVSASADGLGAMMQVLGVHGLTGALEGHRATGFTQHPNDLGGAAGVALVPALFLATWSEPGQSVVARSLRWLLVALVTVGLVLSASVAGMAAGLVGVVVWLSSPSVRAPSRVAIVAAVAATLLVVAMAGGKVTSPTHRLEQVTSPAGTLPGAGSGQERISTVKTAWPRIKQDPLVGTGLDSSGSVVKIFSDGGVVPYQAHGAPLAAWYEAGLFGLIGILMIFGAIAVAGWRSLSAADGEDGLLIGFTLLAAFAAFMLYALAVPFVFQQYGWFSGVILLAWWSRRDSVHHVAATPPKADRAAPKADRAAVAVPAPQLLSR
jgi:O-antigen ligase